MDTFGACRRKAQALNESARKAAGVSTDIPALIELACKYLDVEVCEVAPNDPSLKGALALFDPQGRFILHSNARTPQQRMQDIAHELGHVCIGDGASACTDKEIKPEQATDEAPIGIDKIEDYGIRERRELRANVFAREFLLPRTVARMLFLKDARGAAEIAAIYSLPIDLVRQQLFDSLLIPEPPERKKEEHPDESLDPSQLLAVEHPRPRFQLQAGPGTGKTRTLVARVKELIDGGTDPRTILVLTYSNRAAAELSQRLEAIVGENSIHVWVGTLHSFGLELVRRYHDQLGLPVDFAVFDKSDAIAAMEDIFPTLRLTHYRNLWDPATERAPIIAAISSAKDELASPAVYKRLAEEMLQRAEALLVGEKREEALERAEKALEVASVYEQYENCLAAEHAVDFGDLIFRTTRLLQETSTVREEVRNRHRHVLVDEYQDVNRASVEFLKAIVGPNSTLWVVGDARQSIYRFRGASSFNMASFLQDFPDADVASLQTNYRSTQEVVSCFEQFAQTMSASPHTLRLTAQRGTSYARPDVRSCDTVDDEPGALAAAMRELEKQGVPLEAQAVLCRSNNRLAEIARGLEALGVPVLHLGTLFERPEIRDLLSILSLLVDNWRSALVRVGAMPRYNIPLSDAVATIDRLRALDDRDDRPLDTSTPVNELSSQGKNGLETLDRDLEGLDERSTPWTALATYLLDRTNLLRELALSPSVADHMQGIAIWQLINFARSTPRGDKTPPIIQMLNRVRRLVSLAEDRDLRRVPDEALSMNGVRLMTLHASKGLEFEAVHIPGMVVTTIPASSQWKPCPPPDGLMPSPEGAAETSAAEHAEEEECLFFVGLSRARTYLRLYKHLHLRNGNQRRESPFLAKLAQTIDTGPSFVREERSDGPNVSGSFVQFGADVQITGDLLRAYDHCPRQMMYGHLLHLGTGRRRSPSERVRQCVKQVVEWLGAERLNRSPSLQEVQEYSNNLWTKQKPMSPALSDAYRQLLLDVTRAVYLSSEGRQHRAPEPVLVKIGSRSRSIAVAPNSDTQRADGQRVWTSVKFGRRAKAEADKLIYALYRLATRELRPQAMLESFSMTSGDAKIIERKAKTQDNAETKVEKILDSVERGEFTAEPNLWCPQCAHYFICGPLAPGNFTRR